MRNHKALLTLLALLLAPAAVFADNGVERGTIDFSPVTTVPKPVREFLDKLVFSRCELRGASEIRPNFATETIENSEIGVSAIRYRVDLEVTYKNGDAANYIYADVTLLQGDDGMTDVRLNQLLSRICQAD